MKILDLFKKPKQVIMYSPFLEGLTPGLKSCGKKYTDDILVQSCINSIATEMSKLQPHHIKTTKNGESIVEDDALEKVLQRPNALMTMSDMITKLVWNLYLTCNAFVLPVYSETGEIVALWPVPKADAIEFETDSTGQVYIVFKYHDLKDVVLKYDRIIHIRLQYSGDDYLGGMKNGGPNTKGLTSAISVNDAALTSIERNLAIMSGITGIISQKAKVAETNLVETQKAFERVMGQSGTGVVAIDNSVEYTPIERKTSTVDAGTTKLLEDRILRYYGISTAILSGDFTKAQYEAFYQKTLEPLCIAFSQAFTKALFTIRESTSYGNSVRFYQSELIFMTTSQKLELVRMLGDRGSIYENQILEMFGLSPIPELKGKRMQSLNYIDTDKATEYQMAHAGRKKDDPEPIDDGNSEE